MNRSKHHSLSAALKADTCELCRPEGRMVGTRGQAAARAFIQRRFNEIGLLPDRGPEFALPYHCDGEDFTNFAGFAPRRDHSLEPLRIGAHYDSVIPAPCADDNGAAVSNCLALGDLAVREGDLERDLIIAIFDAEEPPHFQLPSTRLLSLGL